MEGIRDVTEEGESEQDNKEVRNDREKTKNRGAWHEVE